MWPLHHVNVNEFLYHLTMNLFTSSDSEKVYHYCCFDNELVYHLVPKYRETLFMQHSPPQLAVTSFI
jgi:hypothetical protein